MGVFSTATGNAVLNAILRNGSYTGPATLYLALFQLDPGDGGSLTSEIPAGIGYSRPSIAFLAASNKISYNSGAVTFGPASGANWPTAYYIGICDASTAGNLLFHAPLAVPFSVQYTPSAQSVTFPISTVGVGLV